jgi:S1-C subfamily serine protease
MIVLRDASGRELGTGSGFVIASDGTVVTNLHVVSLPEATQAEIRFPDGASYRAQGVLTTDSDRDLALLLVKATNREFPVLPLGDSEHVQVGEHIVAIGSPLAGLSSVSTENTVSDGIVSGIRDWPNGKMRVFQITAPLSPGSSGGVLVNATSQAVGVTFAQLTAGQNLNFAIPSQYVKDLLATSHGDVRPLPLVAEVHPDSTSPSQPPSPPVSPQEVLRSAKTLFIWTTAGSPVLKGELSDKLLEWGKLTLVSSPPQADLILQITQTGELNLGTGSGNQATALLKHRASGTDLWSKTKGGGWAMSGWSNAWVARALAKDFIKFFETTTKPSKR